MSESGIEKRAHRRLYFSAEDDVAGEFAMEHQNSRIPFTAPILNLSIGGVHFTLNKKEDRGIQVGDLLELIRIKGARSVNIDFDIRIKVKWILDHDPLRYVGFGCEFVEISSEIRKCVSDLMESMFAPR